MANSLDSIKFHVYECDADIHDRYVLNRNSMNRFKKLGLNGGGGTDFRPVFEDLQKNHRNVRLLTYLTDGMGTFPEKPAFDVLWISTSEEEYPFGRIIKI